MNVERWSALILAPIAVLAMSAATAQEFPSKSIRLISPFPPGGAVDLLGRTLAPPLSRAFGQGVMVENRPGGNTVIGAEAVMRAPADGHTLLLMAPSFTINPFVRSKLPFDPAQDFSGVTRIALVPMLIAVHPSLPAKELKDLVALARARPGQIMYGTASIVGQQRIAAETLKAAAGIDIVNVPYNGSAPAITAALGGHASMVLLNVSELAPYVTTGKLRAIAVTSAARSDVLKNVPTIAESGYPGVDVTNWFGAVARSATPRSTIQRLAAEISRALQLPEVSDVLTKLGLTPAPMSPEAFDAFLRFEMEKNGRIIRTLNVKAD